MDFEISRVGGIGEYTEVEKMLGSGDDAEKVVIYAVNNEPDLKAFLVLRKNTLEVRTDEELRDLLKEKYETVMESRYFGKGGVEIVNTGQLSADEINDLVRLSYNMSKDGGENE